VAYQHAINPKPPVLVCGSKAEERRVLAVGDDKVEDRRV
jgi:hypothetical protein